MALSPCAEGTGAARLVDEGDHHAQQDEEDEDARVPGVGGGGDEAVADDGGEGTHGVKVGSQQSTCQHAHEQGGEDLLGDQGQHDGDDGGQEGQVGGVVGGVHGGEVLQTAAVGDVGIHLLLGHDEAVGIHVLTHRAVVHDEGQHHEQSQQDGDHHRIENDFAFHVLFPFLARPWGNNKTGAAKRTAPINIPRNL